MTDLPETAPARAAPGPGRADTAVSTLAPRLPAHLVGEAPAHLPLADLPTRVERTPDLASGSGRELFVKRDDETSSLYGGGKVRKLEFILANAPYDNDRPIVSVGGVGSHHLVALALFLAQRNRRLHALTFEQAPTVHTLTDLAVLASLGTRFVHVRRRVLLPFAGARYYLGRRSPRGVYMTPGASTSLGALGFVSAGLELCGQVEGGELPAPGVVYCAAGTAGTAAGLIAGFALGGLRTHLRLVSSVEPIAFNRFMLRRKIGEVVRELRRRGAPDVRRLIREVGVRWSIDHSQVGRGYGVPTPQAQRAVEQASELGLALETTYTGKCLAALQRDLAAAALPEGCEDGPVLFWNTHGGGELAAHIVPDWAQRLEGRLREFVLAADGPRLVRSGR